MKLILASGSPRRQQTLRDAGYTFDTIVSNVDESTIRDDDPERLVQKLASAKATAVAAVLSESALVIGADTVVTFRGKVLEKPSSASEARSVLEGYRNAEAVALHGVAVANTVSGVCQAASDRARTAFRSIPDEVIDELIRTQRVFGWAGSYYPSDPLLAPYCQEITKNPGTAHGLPLNLVARLIDEVSA